MDGWKADEKEIFSDGETSELFIRTSVIVMDSFEVINKGWAQDTTTGKKKTYHQNSQNDYQVVFTSFVFFS